jgi:hypothetical protein
LLKNGSEGAFRGNNEGVLFCKMLKKYPKITMAIESIAVQQTPNFDNCTKGE